MVNFIPVLASSWAPCSYPVLKCIHGLLVQHKTHSTFAGMPKEGKAYVGDLILWAGCEGMTKITFNR